MSPVTPNSAIPLPVYPQPAVIEENSDVMKFLSCIPLVGIFISCIKEGSLTIEMATSQSAPHLIKLIDVKNEYKVANAVRNIFTAALIIVGIACGFFSGTFVSGALLSAVVLTGIAVLNIQSRSQNKKIITELETTGFRPGMRFY